MRPVLPLLLLSLACCAGEVRISLEQGEEPGDREMVTEAVEQGLGHAVVFADPGRGVIALRLLEVGDTIGDDTGLTFYSGKCVAWAIAQRMPVLISHELGHALNLHEHVPNDEDPMNLMNSAIYPLSHTLDDYHLTDEQQDRVDARVERMGRCTR